MVRSTSWLRSSPCRWCHALPSLLRVVCACRWQAVVPKTGRQCIRLAGTTPREIVTKADCPRQASLHQERRRVGLEEAVWRSRGRAVRRCCGQQEGLESASQVQPSVGCFSGRNGDAAQTRHICLCSCVADLWVFDLYRSPSASLRAKMTTSPSPYLAHDCGFPIPSQLTNVVRRPLMVPFVTGSCIL